VEPLPDRHPGGCGTTDLILWIEHAGTKALDIGIEPDA
jgi:hypothetical protein